MLSRREDDELVLPEGLRVRPADPVQTNFGTFRKCSSLTRVEIPFLLLSIVGILISLGFCIEKIISSSQSILPGASEDFVLAIVLTINIVFCLVYVIDGVITEKPYELIIFVIGNLIVLGYVIGNYTFRCIQYLNPGHDNMTLSDTNFFENFTTSPIFTTAFSNFSTTFPDFTTAVPPTTTANMTDNTNYCLDAVKLSRLIMTCVLSPPAIGLGIYVAQDYIHRGEFVFRMVGADASLQTACKILFAAISIIKLDLQLQLSMFVLILHEGQYNIETVEIVILALGVPFSALWALGSYLSLRWENKGLLLGVAISSVVEPAYICYRMYVASQEIAADGSQIISFVAFMFGAGALVARAVHLFLLFLCWQNFMRGLKERVFG